MEQKLYDLMNWVGIGELVYSEASNPYTMLGPHLTEDRLLIQALVPTVARISVKISTTGKKYPVELAGEAGFFTALIPRKNKALYTLEVTYDNEVTKELCNPYSFASQYREEDLKKFVASIHYTIYKKMGAHPMTIDGVPDVYLSVWAPCVMRVNVVEGLSLWGGRHHQMCRLGERGGNVFGLFIPDPYEGEIYKYEIKTRAGEPMLKTDPYTNYTELRPNDASIVWDIDKCKWNDRS